MADLNEAVRIAEERTENAIKDRDNFADKNREYIHLMQQLKDTIADKDLQITEFEDKMGLLKDENKILFEGKEFLQSKLDHIYEHNILIQKDGDKPMNQDLEEKNKQQHTYMNNVQEEIRKLHFQLKRKDLALLKLKQYIQASKNSDEEQDSPDMPDLDHLEGFGTNEEAKGDSKEEEKKLIDLLTSETAISMESLESLTFSTLLAPVDVKKIISNHNALLGKMGELREQSKNQQEEIR